MADKHRFAVRSDGKRPSIAMRPKTCQPLSRCGQPNAGIAIFTSCERETTIGAEGNCPNRTIVLEWRADGPSRCYIPNTGLAAKFFWFVGIVLETARKQSPAIRAEYCRFERSVVNQRRRQQLLSVDAPDSGRAADEPPAF